MLDQALTVRVLQRFSQLAPTPARCAHILLERIGGPGRWAALAPAYEVGVAGLGMRRCAALWQRMQVQCLACWCQCKMCEAGMLENWS